MADYLKIAESDADYLEKTTLFGVTLMELLSEALEARGYQDMPLRRIAEYNSRGPLYVEEGEGFGDGWKEEGFDPSGL